jgi:hypothetical protein
MLARDIGLVAGVLFMRRGVVSIEERRGEFKKVRGHLAGHMRRIKNSGLDDLNSGIDPAAPFEPFEIRPTLLSKVALL